MRVAAGVTSIAATRPAPARSPRLALVAVLALLLALVAVLDATPTAAATSLPERAVGASRFGRESSWDPHRAVDEAGRRPSPSTAPLPTTGEARYVAANGDDDAAGTADAPWATVRHAIAAVGRDATIVVYGRHRGHGDGIYRGHSWGRITRPGLTIRAYPGESPVFTGARDLDTSADAWSRYQGTWYLDRHLPRTERWPANPYPIDDQVTDGRPLADDPHQLFEGPEGSDGTRLRRIDPGDWATSGGPDAWSLSRVDDTTVRIRVGADPAGRRLAWSARQVAVQVNPGGRGTTIAGIAFTRYAPHHGNTLGAVRVLANDVTLTDVEVSDAAGTGVAATGENGTLSGPLRRLTLHRVSAVRNGALGASIGDAGREGHDDAVRNDVLIEYSRFSDNNRNGFDVDGCGDSCVLAGAKLVRLSGLVVRYSAFTDNHSVGLWCDLYCDDVSVVGNAITGNSRTGLFYEVSRRATVASNVVARNGPDGPGDGMAAGLKVTGSHDVVVEHNTFHDNAPQQIALGADHRDEGPDWHTGGSGDPSVALVGNLFVTGAGHASVGVIGSEPATPAWFEAAEDNGYVAEVGGGLPVPSVPDEGGDRVLRSSAAVFGDAPGRDYRVVLPEVTEWTTGPWGASALSALRRSGAPQRVGAAPA